MTKLSDAAKAPLSITHEGREYTLSPLELGDFAELERWLQVLPYDLAARKLTALGKQATPEVRKDILADAKAESSDSAVWSPGFGRKLASLEGTAYLLYLSLRHAHPDITRENAGRLILMGDIEEWQRRLDVISGLADTESDPTGAPAESASPSTGQPPIE